MIIYEGQSYQPLVGETVLECLTRSGVGIPSFCRSGVCQTCLLRELSGNAPAKAQAGLKESWRQQGLLLACLCDTATELVLTTCDAAATFLSRVVRVEVLTERVVRVLVEKPAGFDFAAGQFVQLGRVSDGTSRPYSIASLPSDPELEFHVALQPGGALSPWLQNAVGEAVSIKGPFGDCFYVSNEPQRALLLAGTGTGLAPLWGVARAALEQGHEGPVALYHGARTAQELYLWPELRALARRFNNLEVHGVVLEGEPTPPVEAEEEVSGVAMSQGLLDEVVLAAHGKPMELRAYLCGNPDLVGKLKKRLYLAGASLSRIHSDPFLAPGG